MLKHVSLKFNPALILASLSFFATSAHAALPAEAQSALSAATSAVSDSAAAAWVPIGAAMAALIVIKLVKRFFNKI